MAIHYVEANVNSQPLQTLFINAANPTAIRDTLTEECESVVVRLAHRFSKEVQQRLGIIYTRNRPWMVTAVFIPALQNNFAADAEEIILRREEEHLPFDERFFSPTAPIIVQEVEDAVDEPIECSPKDMHFIIVHALLREMRHAYQLIGK